MIGTEPIHLILDDLSAIKDHLSSLSREELATLGQALVDLTEASRAAYRATPVPQYAPAKVALYAQQYHCISCGRTWVGPDKVPGGFTSVGKVCGLCNSKSQRAMPTPDAPLNEVMNMQPNAVDDGIDELQKTGDLADGTYTVTFGDGQYKTLKIKTQALDATFAPGKTTASYLNGLDNYRNYKGFAFINDDGSYNLYRAFRDSPNDGRTEMALRVLLSGKEAMVEGLRAYGRASGTCGVCGRKLTTPESLDYGIGPICAGRL